MPNFIEKYPIVLVAGAIGAGLLIRRYLGQRQAANNLAQASAIQADQNPWNMQTTSLMDAYQYYTTSTNQSTLVYGVGQEVNLVSTTMLENALAQQHDQIMQEVTVELNALTQSFDQYVQTAQAAYNPYNVAIAGAANGAQMAWPSSNTNNVNTD